METSTLKARDPCGACGIFAPAQAADYRCSDCPRRLREARATQDLYQQVQLEVSTMTRNERFTVWINMPLYG